MNSRPHDPGSISGLYASLRLEFADGPACDCARALGSELISDGIALAVTFRRVQERTQSTVFVFREAGEITGALGMIPITPDGLRAIEEHRFDPRNPPDEYLCRPGDSLAAIYGWGIVGTTRKASATVIAGVKSLRDHLKNTPFFTRTATAAGQKVVRGRLGYLPYPNAPDDLLWNPVSNLQERAA